MGDVSLTLARNGTSHRAEGGSRSGTHGVTASQGIPTCGHDKSTDAEDCVDDREDAREQG
jgi:hypothetical protein